MPANNQKKIIAAIISMSMLAFVFVEPVAAQVGLSVGSNSLNLTDPGHNLFYGLTSGSTATGSFMKFQKGAGNTVFQVDYNGNITTTGSFSGNVSGLVNGLDLTNINPNIMENRYSSFESFYNGQPVYVAIAPGATGAVSSDYSIDGNYSYKLTTNSTDGYCILNSNLTMNVKPSTKYIFSYYAYRASGSVAGAQMYTKENGAAGTYRGCTISPASLGTGKWVRCSTSFTTASDATRLDLIRADVDSNGTATETIYFDGVQIEEVSASATLASPYRSPAFNPWVDSLLGTAFSGNVGIGTTSLSTYKLNVAGNFSASNGNVVGDTSGNINFESFNDRSNPLYKLDPSSSANSLNVAGSITALGTSAHNYFAGRVGIRNSSPGAQLEVEIGNSGTETFLLSDSFNNHGLRTGHNGYAGLFGYQQGNDTGGGGSYGTVLSMNAFYNGTSWSTRNGWIIPSFINLGLGGNIIFATQSTHQGGTAGVYTPTEVMRINSAGNLGLGTSNPRLRFEARGVAGPPATSGTTQNAISRFGGQSGTFTHVLDIGEYSVSPYGIWFQATNEASLGMTYPLVLNPNGGFVGIGTSTPQAKLSVTGGNIFVYDAAITSLTPKAVITKEYLDDSLSSTTASIITQVSTSSFWQGQLNNDIWANNTLNVGIGTTDPGVKLDVVGGAIRTNNQLISTIANGTAPLSVVSATQVNNLTSQYAGSLRVLSPNGAIDYNAMSYGRTYDYGSGNTRSNGPTGMSYGSVYNFGGGDASQLSLQMAADINHNSTASTRRLWFRTGNNLGFQNDWKEIYHSGNLTNNLSTGYTPKWDGAKFINSVIYDNGTNIGIGTSTSLLGKLHVSGTGYFTNTVTVGTPTAGGHAITRDYLDQTLLNKLTAQSIGTLNVNAIGDIFALYGGSTSGWSNRGPSGHNGGAILHIPTHTGGYYSDLWFDTANNRVYSRAVNAGTIGGWSLLPKVSASTANYLTKWSSEDSLTRSIIYDNGSSVGIGTTNPGAYKLNVNGFSKLDGGVAIDSTSGNWVYYPNVVSYSSSETIVGALILHTNIARNSNEMFKIRVTGYGYANSTNIDFTVVGYAYSGTGGSVDGVSGAVVNYSIVDNGNDGLPKRIGVDASGNIAISVGETNSSFYYYRLAADYWSTGQSINASTGWSIDTNTVAGFNWKDIKALIPTINTNSSNVGIGTTNPQKRLDLGGGDNGRIFGIDTSTSAIFTDSEVVPKKWIVDNFAPAVGGASLWATSSAGTYNVGLGNVGVGTTGPISKLHVNGGDILMSNNTTYGTWRYGAKISVASRLKGRQVNNNPDFLEGLNGYSIYDNNYSGSITLTLVNDATSPNSSGRVMELNHSTSGTPSPYFGGFYKAINRCSGISVGECYREGNRLVYRMWAKIPVGYNLTFHANPYGTGGSHTFLSSSAGTGSWEEYVAVLQIGYGGTFSSTGFWAISGSTRPFVWQVASLDIIDIDQPQDVDRASELNVGYKNNIVLGPGNLLSTQASYFAVDGGNVGIGTTSPSTKLHVYDAASGPLITMSGLDTNYRGLAIKNTSNAEQWFLGNNASNNLVFRRSGSSDYLTILASNGNVGIGTTNPSLGKLQVVSSQSGEQPLTLSLINEGYGVGTGNKIQFYTALGGTNKVAQIRTSVAGNNNGDLMLDTANGTDFANVMTLKGSGNVGIGTTTVESKLTVSGDLELISPQFLRDGHVITKKYLNDSLNSFNASTNFWKLNGSNLYSSSTAWNVGIGTTNPTEKLTVNGDANITGNSYSSKIVINPTSGTGWYRIASGNGSGGTVYLNAYHDNRMQRLEFNYNMRTYISNGIDLGTINVLRTFNYNSGPISKIRLTGNSVDGNYNVYLDVYVNSATTPAPFTIYGTNGASFLSSPIYNPAESTYSQVVDLSDINFSGISTSRNLNVSGNSSFMGNVGIGTTNQVAKTTINSSSANPISLRDGFSSLRLEYNGGWNDGESGPQITFAQRYYSGDSAIIRTGAIRGIKSYSTGSFAGGLQLLYQPNGNVDMVPGITMNHSGNVGIGTTNPTSKLELVGSANDTISSANATAKIGGNAGDGSVSLNIGRLNGTPNYGVWMQAYRPTDDLTFQLLLNPKGGNVAIGTTTVDSKLTVSGDLELISPQFLRDGHVITKKYLNDSLNAFNASTNFWKLNGSNLYSSSTAWNVGIGTTSPSSKLDVYGQTTLGNRDRAGKSIFPLYISDSSNLGWKVSDSNGNAKFELYAGLGGVNEMRLMNGVGIVGYGQDLLLGTDTGTTSAVIKRNTGNVGIGTTNPSTKLEVGNYLDSFKNTLTIASLYQYEPEINFRLGQSGTNYDWSGAKIVVGDDGNYNGKIEFKTAIAGRAAPTTKMIIKANGNVSIGTTTVFNSRLTILGDAELISPSFVSDGHVVTKKYLSDSLTAFKTYHVSGVTDIYNIPTSTTNSMYTFFSSAVYPSNSPVASSSWVQGIQFPLASNPDYRQILASNDGNLYYGSQSNKTWSPWRKLWDSGNLTNNLTANYLPKWNGSSLANSLIYDNGTSVAIGTNSPATGRMTINETTGTVHGASQGSLVLDHNNTGGASSISFRSYNNRGSDYGFIQYQDTSVIGAAGESARLIIGTSNDTDDHILLMPSGNVGIGNTNPTAKLVINPSPNTVSITAAGAMYNNDNNLWLKFDSLLTDSLKVQGNVKSTSGHAITKTGYVDRNLLPTYLWTIGSGSVGGFSLNGSASENERAWDIGPFGQPAMVWKSVNDAASDADGGWSYSDAPVNSNKSYRLTVWVKKNNQGLTTNTGNVYLGCGQSGNTLNLNGTANDNPYFLSFNSNIMQPDRWYLLVGYIRANSDSSTTNSEFSGVYDGLTGQKIVNGVDYKNSASATVQTHRVYNYYDANAGSIQYFWGPRFEEIDGNEPSIEAMLGVGKSATRNVAGYFANSIMVATTTVRDQMNIQGTAHISGGLNVGGLGSFSSLNVSGKLTVNTIDPLYKIKGVSYSTFAPSFVGGVKEEISGRLKISEKTGDEYQAVIDFTKQKLGSDLWVWYNVIDFNKDNVEAVITPYGSFANVYYYISGTKIVFKADRPAEISYRLTGKRFDWRKWPTRADDQTERPSFIID